MTFVNEICSTLKGLLIPTSPYYQVILLDILFLLAIWILIFRKDLKCHIALAAAGLFLSHVLLFAIDENLLYLYISDWGLHQIVMEVYEYLMLAVVFLLYKLFVREGWGKTLLVYGVKVAALAILEHFGSLTDAVLAAAGLSAAGLPGIIDYIAITVIFGAAIYLLLYPRLKRMDSPDIKWLWLGFAAYHVLYRFGFSVWFEIYNVRLGLRVNPSDPVFLFFVGAYALFFFLIVALLIVILDNVHKNKCLKHEVVLKDQVLDLQRQQYERLTENAEHEKIVRHDHRHQLAVLKEYGAKGDLEKLGEYLNQLAGSIPAYEEMYCENYAVNAVIAHHLQSAEGESISLDLKLDIPQETGSVTEMDLCVIVGNLLENAVEACRRMESGERFIRARSLVEKGRLVIAVDNSFDGLFEERRGTYFSRKQEGVARREGIGLSSVKAMCEKHGGAAKFTAEGNVWSSTAVVVIG